MVTQKPKTINITETQFESFLREVTDCYFSKYDVYDFSNKHEITVNHNDEYNKIPFRTIIRGNFIEDFGGYEYEGLYVDHDDEGGDNASLIAVLKNQKALIEKKYEGCNIKPSIRSNLVNN